MSYLERTTFENAKIAMLRFERRVLELLYFTNTL